MNLKINHNPIWSYTSNQPYKILMIGGLGSGKAFALLNLIKHQRPDISKIYLYVKDPCESKYLWKRKSRKRNEKEKVGIKKLKNPRAFIDYSQTIDDAYENLKDYNATKKRKVLIGVWWYDSTYRS